MPSGRGIILRGRRSDFFNRPMTGKIIIANWKMNLDISASVSLAQELLAGIAALRLPDTLEIVACPSYDALSSVGAALAGSSIRLGAQNVFWQEKGPFTGEVSPSMLRAAGVSHVIIGHSERRRYLREDDEMANKKIAAALAARLTPILCVGETFDERSAGHTDLILMRQVIHGLQGVPVKPEYRIIIAYEPVWVIGTGQAIEPAMAQHATDVIMQSLIDLYPLEAIRRQMRIIYGGSVDESNITDYLRLPRMEGALVGTASLRPDKFVPLLQRIEL